MAVLSDPDRAALTAEWQRDPAFRSESCSITKADLRAAINGLDAYLDSNAIAINNAIPQPARGALTQKQKARLLIYVVRRRYEVT